MVDIEVLIVCLICFFVESVCLDFVELFLSNHELWTHSIRITFVDRAYNSREEEERTRSTSDDNPRRDSQNIDERRESKY